MVKILSLIVAVIALLSFTTGAYAANEEVLDGMAAKLVRGVVNTFTGWIEFPMQIKKGWDEGFMANEDQKLLGAVVGIFDGFGHSLGRTGSGLTDLFCFWAVNPESNEGVGFPLDAEYAWEEGEAYDIFEPDFYEGAVVPFGKKIIRGAGNSLLGVAELPGQIVKGVDEGEIGIGVIKGFWFWFSRGAYGMADIMTSLLPIPVDEMGYAFEEEWPWEALTDSL